jgi:hypothetical protein
MIGIYCIIPFCFAFIGFLAGVSWALGMGGGFLWGTAAAVGGGFAGFVLGHLYLRVEQLGERITNRNWTLGCLFSLVNLIFFFGIMIGLCLAGTKEMFDRERPERLADRAARAGAEPATDVGGPWDKITFDIDGFNAEGLRGPADGKVAVSYEFCIPDTAEAREEVAAIDPTVEFMASSPGRIGCGTDECLCIGSTHQAGFREVLEDLAELPYVDQIDESVFE